MTPPWRYRLLLRALSPLLLGYTAWRASRDGGWRYLRQRLGCYPRHDSVENDTTRSVALWVHAASVGEVNTVLPLVKAWQSRHAKRLVLFTCNTPTGAAVLERHMLAGTLHQYLPLDFPGAIRRFLSQFDIERGWIVETEIWPWLYHHSARKGISLSIVNGRLSARTHRQAGGLLAESYRRALSEVNVFAKSVSDAENFRRLGAKEERIQCMGNLKLAGISTTAKYPRPITRHYVLAASTHKDEELQLSRAWLALEATDLLVIVPRHPERGNALQRSLSELGESVSQRSRGEEPGSDDRLHIADTLGEMQAWYEHAQAAFVGGSLVDRGGHNMLEPLAFACPTVTGMYTSNFEDIMQSLLEANLISVAHTPQQIVDYLLRAAQGDRAQREMARRGKDFLARGGQLIERYLQALEVG